jgi:hypothetical protein
LLAVAIPMVPGRGAKGLPSLFSPAACCFRFTYNLEL